jgi:TolB-like protein/Tfp pilus assembly protein PilF
MGEESPKAASNAPMGAVFLSYASQDAAAAQKVCEGLRGAGIEVWFDQTELRGGDVWDRNIRQQIHDCRLFIAVISAHTDERDEGYFRREWKLAVDRTHDMAEDKAFVVPVVIDGTSERKARVPDSFKHVHWTRLPGGETPRAFVERVRRLVSPEASPGPATNRSASTVSVTSTSARPSLRWKAALLGISTLAVVGVGWLVVDRILGSKHAAAGSTSAPAAQSAAPSIAAFNPPSHSIAVLPFVNMSGDASQSYFSDGLTEELLNSLSRINELQVAARTSSFSFQGEHPDIAAVAHKLNVAAVLEGSVRRSAHTVRITAQLVNGSTGYHLWSQTYDRNLGDVLALQAEIATAVASALKVTLLGDEAAKIELGGTRNPAAFDAYLRASKTWAVQHGAKEMRAAIASYDEALRLDPKYALAYAGRSLALGIGGYASQVTGQGRHEALDNSAADARKAIELAPDLAESHLALASVLQGSFDFEAAGKEYDRALTLGPGNARLLRIYGPFAVNMGWTDTGLTALRRGVVLDPLGRNQHRALGDALTNARRYEESIAAYREAMTIDPDDTTNYINIGDNYFLLGDLQNSKSWCEAKPEDKFSSACLAVAYDKLGRHSDAEAALAKFRTSSGDIFPYVNALIYAQWGNTAKALEWLETAMSVHDIEIEQLKVDPLLDPLRNEPRFQAIERKLKFPRLNTT